MKIWMLVSVIAALFLTGCGTPVPDSDAQDWCYVFDFTTGQQGFLITSGSLTAQGITSDSTGLLQTSYGYDRDVYPNFVIVNVVRPTGITGDIEATAAGTAFGIQTYFTATMPADINSAPLVFTPPANGVEIIGDRNAINITVDGSQPIAIASIDIRGMGASPFPSNPCDDSTPTPGTPTGTPSGTPTLTATATATSTGTVTPSATPVVCDFDLTDDFSVITVQPSWSHYPGEGYARGSINLKIFPLNFGIPGTITRVILTFNQSWSGTADFYLPNSTIQATRTTSGSVWDLTGLSITNGISINLYNAGTNTAPSTLRWSHMTVEGSSCAAATSTPGPTNTPGATNTPVMTNTPEPLWSSCLDFTVDAFSFSAVSAAYNDVRGFVQAAPEWRIGRGGLATGAKKKVKLVFEPGQSFSGLVRLSDNGSNHTSWKSMSGNSVIADFSTGEAWVPTSIFWIEFDGNNIPLALQRLCWLDPNPSTGTPIPGTGTPAQTRTPMPTTTARPLPSRTPIGIPLPPVIIITATGGVPITTTPIYGGTGVYSATGTTSPLITGTPGTGTPGGTGFGSGGGGFGDVGDMVGFSWNIGWGLLGALIAYLGQATNIVTGLLTAFTNATPQAIPGLPLCITNPMAHDLCAIWYIMDNTIFAPSTPGQYIVPLMQIIFNVVIAIFFVRFVLRLIRRGEEVTHVE